MATILEGYAWDKFVFPNVKTSNDALDVKHFLGVPLLENHSGSGPRPDTAKVIGRIIKAEQRHYGVWVEVLVDDEVAKRANGFSIGINSHEFNKGSGKGKVAELSVMTGSQSPKGKYCIINKRRPAPAGITLRLPTAATDLELSSDIMNSLARIRKLAGISHRPASSAVKSGRGGSSSLSSSRTTSLSVRETYRKWAEGLDLRSPLERLVEKSIQKELTNENR